MEGALVRADDVMEVDMMTVDKTTMVAMTTAEVVSMTIGRMGMMASEGDMGECMTVLLGDVMEEEEEEEKV